MTVRTESGITIITAENGKVFKSAVTNEILSNELWLGENDSAENYTEVTPPPTLQEQINGIQAIVDDLSLSLLQTDGTI